MLVYGTSGEVAGIAGDIKSVLFSVLKRDTVFTCT
jgi:hypothetical protein